MWPPFLRTVYFAQARWSLPTSHVSHVRRGEVGGGALPPPPALLTSAKASDAMMRGGAGGAGAREARRTHCLGRTIGCIEMGFRAIPSSS